MSFNLEEYLTGGVVRLVQGIAKASFSNPKTSLFMTQFMLSNKVSNQKRKDAEQRGEHIPPFLIASITTQCNLHCAGCYARANHNCTDGRETNKVLTANEWDRIFKEAEDLGISFILLAGGEPFMKQEILRIAGEHKKILFPIFTNGTMLQGTGMQILDKYPNLLPILSIEGNEETTDIRRGKGTYLHLTNAMIELKKKSKLFGASVTVQTNNLEEVTSRQFISEVAENGCKAVVYVEYVPVGHSSKKVAMGETERQYLADRIEELRKEYKDMIFVSFPGDEQAMGGCLAAGRGFFHINAHGGAEPCPFSAYSDSSLKEMSLKQALQSPLFIKLRENGMLEETHVGGCTLFEQEEMVKALL